MLETARPLSREGKALKGRASVGRSRSCRWLVATGGRNLANLRLGSTLQYVCEPWVAKAVKAVRNREGGTCAMGGTIVPKRASCSREDAPRVLSRKRRSLTCERGHRSDDRIDVRCAPDGGARRSGDAPFGVGRQAMRRSSTAPPRREVRKTLREGQRPDLRVVWSVRRLQGRPAAGCTAERSGACPVRSG